MAVWLDTLELSPVSRQLQTSYDQPTAYLFRGKYRHISNAPAINAWGFTRL